MMFNDIHDIHINQKSKPKEENRKRIFDKNLLREIL